jgi:hypothetical protein
MSAAVDYWTGTNIDYREYVSLFSGSGYYFMGKTGVEEKLTAFMNRIKANESVGMPYDMIKVIIVDPSSHVL